MSFDRKQILEMLSQGKVNVDEAEKLLRAVGEPEVVSQSFDPHAFAAAKPIRPKYLRITVQQEGGGSKVNVRVPFQLLRAGVRLTSLIPEPVQTRLNEEMGKNGINFDIRKMKPEDLDSLVDQLADLSIDVDDPENKVRIFCE